MLLIFEMKGRVEFQPPGYIGISIDWQKLVKEPQKEGMYIEAFGSADAIIDCMAESLFRQIYNEDKCQDLINHIHYLRGSVNFDGLIILRILESKSVIDRDFVERVRQFKKARNLVLHNQEAEYRLLYNPDFQFPNTQEEFDELAKKEADKWLDEGLSIFIDMDRIIREVHEKGSDYYFSIDFYTKNPAKKKLKEMYPKESKKCFVA